MPMFQTSVLIDSSSRARISGFYLSRVLDSSEAISDTIRGGTTRWMAPELLDPEKYGIPEDQNTITKESDVYALAITIWEVIDLYPERPK
jgi:serine/threonine protein kinase